MKKFLATLRNTNNIFIELVILKKSYGNSWKRHAERKIQTSEIVIIYDSEACAESENTIWEIKQAENLGKTIIKLSRSDIEKNNVAKLRVAYNFDDEFDECFGNFKTDTNQLLELYKIMVASSEQLIQRRQITNGFFLTVIGAIFAASGLIMKENIVTDNTILVLVFPIIIGLFMCRSWKNLIKNYGKLNAGKFEVIHRIEREFGAKIFEAEWVALGKGVRKEKYQSFTSTEQNVPSLFSALLYIALIFTLFSANWDPAIDFLKASGVYSSQLMDNTQTTIIENQ